MRITRCVTLSPSCYIALFIRQSIDREQIFDVTFQTPPIEKSYARHWPDQTIFVIFWKTTIAISSFCTFLKSFKRTKLSSLFSPPCLEVKSKICLKACILV